MAIDPVCGVHVDEKESESAQEYMSQYAGQTFYFCSEDCRTSFEEVPERYARKPA